MRKDNILGLQLQKEISHLHINLDSEFERAFRELKMNSSLKSSGITKLRGYMVCPLAYFILLLPFIKQKITNFWNSSHLKLTMTAQKDVYYRFINKAGFNWRSFVYKILFKVIKEVKDTPFKERVLIVDDTLIERSGKKMEMVSYHHNHTTGRSTLGQQWVQLALMVGNRLFPVDVAGYVSSKRPNEKQPHIDNRSCTYRRYKESYKKKTELLVELIQRAHKRGIDACCVLFDSWYAHDIVISQVLNTGYNVICRLKNSKASYTYQGSPYGLKQLWEKTKRQCRKSSSGMRYVRLLVTMKHSGTVQIVFVSEKNNTFAAFLSTDSSLEPMEVIAYYSRRWGIEVFFKEAKQYLGLGQEQCRSFAGNIAHYSLTMIRHLMVSYILLKYREDGSIGPLFAEIMNQETYLDEGLALYVMIKKVYDVSSRIFSDVSPAKLTQKIFDIFEKPLVGRSEIVTAKL